MNTVMKTTSSEARKPKGSVKRLTVSHLSRWTVCLVDNQKTDGGVKEQIESCIQIYVTYVYNLMSSR